MVDVPLPHGGFDHVVETPEESVAFESGDRHARLKLGVQMLEQALDDEFDAEVGAVPWAAREKHKSHCVGYSRFRRKNGARWLARSARGIAVPVRPPC